MGLRISSFGTLRVNRNLTDVTAAVNRSLDRLSSGRRINSAADGAADLAIAETFRSQIRSLDVAQNNTAQGIALAATADSALGEIGDLLVEMRALAVQSANETLSSSQRASVQSEFSNLRSEITRIAQRTEFNGINPLDGNGGNTDIQVGINAGDTITVSGVDARATTLGLDGLNVSTAAGGSSSLGAIDSAIRQVSSLRGQFGSSQRRLESASRLIAIQIENTSAAESAIRDTDVASEVASLTRNQVIQEAGIAVLTQANQNMGLLLKLL